jgi:hypothetical protein
MLFVNLIRSGELSDVGQKYIIEVKDMYIAKLKQYRECLEGYKNQKSDEVNKAVADEKTKELWHIELSFISDILKLIKKYEKVVSNYENRI